MPPPRSPFRPPEVARPYAPAARAACCSHPLLPGLCAASYSGRIRRLALGHGLLGGPVVHLHRREAPQSSTLLGGEQEYARGAHKYLEGAELPIKSPFTYSTVHFHAKEPGIPGEFRAVPAAFLQ